METRLTHEQKSKLILDKMNELRAKPENQGLALGQIRILAIRELKLR